MTTKPLEQAISTTRDVLAGVSKEQLGNDTPCDEWKVSDLINHIVGGQFWFATVASGDPPDDTEIDFADADFVAFFDDASRRALGAFGRDGVLQATLTLPWGPMDGSAFMNLATLDTFTHGWDLAKATGQNTDLAPDLAQLLLDGSKQSVPDAFRAEKGGVFALEQPAPEGACAADKLAAFLGRTV